MDKRAAQAVKLLRGLQDDPTSRIDQRLVDIVESKAEIPRLVVAEQEDLTPRARKSYVVHGLVVICLILISERAYEWLYPLL